MALSTLKLKRNPLKFTQFYIDVNVCPPPKGALTYYRLPVSKHFENPVKNLYTYIYFRKVGITAIYSIGE